MLFLVTLMGLAAAAAQNTAPAVPSLDQGLPIDVSAAGKCEVLEQDDMVECSGDVRVTQGDTLLAAERMTIIGISDERGFRRIEAEGGVRYAADDSALSGEKAVFDADSDTLTVTGDVVVVQADQIMTGGRLVYNTVTGATMFTPEQGGRVRGVFYSRPGKS